MVTSKPQIPMQTDPALLKHIQREGCLFLCYLYHASDIVGHTWTPQQVNLAYHAFVRNKWMKENCLIQRPDDILVSLAVPVLRWVRHESPDYVPRQDEREILEYITLDHTHWIVPGWDPLGDSNTVRTGRLNRKVIIRIQEAT